MMNVSTCWSHALFSAALMASLLIVSGCGGESPPDEESPADVNAQTEAETPEWPVTNDPSMVKGMAVFAEVCSRCHIESEYAPTITSLRQWDRRMASREADGASARDVFVTHAVEGFGDMLPKGGKRGKDLTDEQVAQGVDYMLWAVEQHRAAGGS